ncbi:hypothetical protein [Flavobacterium sp. 3HN19-14]|uniref:hypothetical protein n=1 Tax=Flavobacterium sp. 3HN19-14 TaxID=3448133 RepID=UPI003EE3A66F
MKKLCFLAVFLLSFASYGKSIPTPLLYRLSKRILAETEHFISDNNTTKTTIKTKSGKQKLPKSCPLKCQPKKEIKVIFPAFLSNEKRFDPWNDDSK